MKFSFQLATSALLLGWLQVANAAAIPMTQTTLADVQSQKVRLLILALAHSITVGHRALTVPPAMSLRQSISRLAG